MLRKFLVKTSFSAALVAASLLLSAPAGAGVLDMWNTPVNISTSGTAAFTPTSQFAADIYDISINSPDPVVYGTVSRTATVSQPYNSPAFSGRPYSEAHTAPSGLEQHLFFNSHDTLTNEGNGQLAIEYQFGIAGGISASHVSIEVANSGANTINIAMFSQKTGTTSWLLGDYDPFAGNTPLTEYSFPTNTSNNISGLMIVYNPLNALLSGYSFVDSSGNALLSSSLPFLTNEASVEVELCCVITSVPEPSSMVLGFIGIGLSVVVYRKRNEKCDKTPTAALTDR
jgi:hypothetical protein